MRPRAARAVVCGGVEALEATAAQSVAATRREEKKRLKGDEREWSWNGGTVQQTRGRAIISVEMHARAMGFPGEGEQGGAP